MHVTTLLFKTNPTFDTFALSHLIYELAAILASNGQCSRTDPIISFEVGVCAFTFLAPEADSFSAKNHSKEVVEMLGRLASEGVEFTESDSKPALETDEPCVCHKSDAYALYTNCLSVESPLLCLSCFRHVPLYRISKDFPGSLEGLIRWQSNYKSCDELQLGSWALEKQATAEMSKWNSDLSRQGIAIAKKISKATCIPTYYFLYRDKGKSLKSELVRRCPKCKRKWRLKKRQYTFDFRCDKCYLLSNIAWDIRE